MIVLIAYSYNIYWIRKYNGKQIVIDVVNENTYENKNDTRGGKEYVFKETKADKLQKIWGK